MPAQKGKDLLIKIGDGGSGFVTVAGLRTRQIAFNAETVDVTNAESAGRWRELLAGVGVRRAGVTGSGVFKDEASDARMRQVFFDGDILTYQIVVPDFGRIEGPFQITSLEYRGDHAGEVTFEMAFESAGALTFVALHLGNRRYTLCLTLGALAELEEAFGADDLMALAERFGTGRLSSRDLIMLLAVAMRGGGHDLSDAEVASLPLVDGIEPMAAAITDLLVATFGAQGPSSNPLQPQGA